jgi:signal transduction histidine kinase
MPLARAASTALRQRDQVAAASDSERRRLAADLHDGPLQSLTLLAYRLEVTGDAENAELARDVTTELRAITASLRLPVVDDLGTGPALEWLTERVGRLAGTPIDLEHRQDGRPPREVEHAIFRVAQEALANAARHGRPPIQVRYEADAAHASLIVQDAGDGAMVQARSGRGLGIVGMRERAHAIGADIELAQSAAGMKVSLVWPGTAS